MKRAICSFIKDENGREIVTKKDERLLGRGWQKEQEQ